MTEINTTTEEQTRNALARALAEKSERFNAQVPTIAASAEKPASPLAARLAELSTPAPQPKRELSGAAHALQPLAVKATELLARFDAAKSKMTDAVAEYAVVDIKRIVNLVPPSDALGSNWFRLRELVNASKEISSLLANSTYDAFAKLTNIITQFATGAITTYAPPVDGKRDGALVNADAALLHFKIQLDRFENNVTAFENYLGVIATFEPLVMADFKLAEQAPATPAEMLPAAREIKPAPQPTYANWDPLAPPAAPKDDRVAEIAVEGGVKFVTTRRA
jgi:hypothetical protein